MMGLGLLAVLLGISSSLAQQIVRVEGPSECLPQEPPKVEHGCYVVPEFHNGCLLGYNYKCMTSLPQGCKDPENLPSRDRGDCAWISLHDDRHCILGFECAQLPPDALPNSELLSFPEPADVEAVDTLSFPEIPQSQEVEVLDEPEMTKAATTKVLKDSVLFGGVKPAFAAPVVNPILAPRPAFAVQPVVPIRAPPVPIVRPVFRPVPPACPPMPGKPLDNEYCTWVAVKDHRHCIRQWECDPVPEPPVRCPRAPIKPDVGDRCNWIPILDKNNCIRKYECEPIPPEGCPPAPLPPDDHDRCKWVSIKDAQGCIMDYECVPIKGGRLFPGGADRNGVCCWWAMKGECDRNTGWMRSNCPASCNAPGCADGFHSIQCLQSMRAARCPFPL